MESLVKFGGAILVGIALLFLLVIGAGVLGQIAFNNSEAGAYEREIRKLELEADKMASEAELVANEAELMLRRADLARAEGERNERTLIAQGVKSALEANARTVNRMSAVQTWYGILAPFGVFLLVIFGAAFAFGFGALLGAISLELQKRSALQNKEKPA